jgi:hypothetical protein
MPTAHGARPNRSGGPRTHAQLRAIAGIGDKKLERYGDALIALVDSEARSRLFTSFTGDSGPSKPCVSLNLHRNLNHK